MSVIRAFIAIDLSVEIQRELDKLSSLLRQQMKGLPVRWVPAGNIHLTLKFLGNVSVANLPALQNALQAEAGRCSPFEVRVGDVGAFPSARRPRVVWAHVPAPPELNRLQRSVEEGVNRLGYPPEARGFTPHLTLGRVSQKASNAEVQRIGQALEAMEVGELGAMQVEALRLYRSDLQPSGAIYTCIFTAPLKPER